MIKRGKIRLKEKRDVKTLIVKEESNPSKNKFSSIYSCIFEYIKTTKFKLILLLIIIMVMLAINYKIIIKHFNININNNIRINNNTRISHKKNENKTEGNFENFISTNLFSINDIISFSDLENKFYKTDNISYTYSQKYKRVKLEYMVSIYDEQKNIIYPSDLRLYYDFHVSCFLEIYNNDNNNISIYSLAGIHENKYFKCIEYFNISETVTFGIKIYKVNIYLNYYTIYCSKDITFNYNNSLYENDGIFDSQYIINEYNASDSSNKNTKTLKEYYMLFPLFDLKRNIIKKENVWYFKNIYNNYFCFCIGEKCLNKQPRQICKYLFYMDIIEQNKNIYPKTDYLFVDFIFEGLSSDDTYPIFQKMIEINYPVHYITNKKSIKEKYCNDMKYCKKILDVNHYSYYFYADFIEKYLSLILKLKAVISCRESNFHFVSYLFYRIEYITYIAIGHGVCYFKDYLFDENRIYGKNINNKILIPPSKILIDVAKRYGWKDEDIIKLNLPRWDKYNEYNNELSNEGGTHNFVNNSLLVMFTWRYSTYYFNGKISTFYIKNITDILTNKLLNKVLAKKNITLYFSFHRYINKRYKIRFENILKNKKHIKFIDQNDISACLSKTSLVVSDFSSIIFDLMYRRKPFIIYVPDSNDPKIRKIYAPDYIYLIESMNKGKFELENQCHTVKQTVKKIIYYINNNFKLDEKLIKFYEIFGLKNSNNNIDSFINYLNIIN